jgi:hypothetical protein
VPGGGVDSIRYPRPCRNCVKTIESLESRIRDPEKENDVKKVRGDELDDFYDETRYGYYSWATAQDAVKPTELRVAERLGNLWATDPTAAMYQVSRIQQEEEAKSAPTFYSGNARQRMMQMARKGRSW